MERKINELISELYTKVLALKKEKEAYGYDEITRMAHKNEIGCLDAQIDLCREVIKSLKGIID